MSPNNKIYKRTKVYLWSAEFYKSTTLYLSFLLNTITQRNTAFYAVLTHCVAARTRIGLL